MWHDAHGLRAVVGLAEAVLIAGAVIGIVPATALMIEIAYVTRGRPHAGLLRSFSGGVRSLPSMLLLLVLSGLAQALLLGIGAGVAHLVEQVAHGRLGEAAAGVLQGAVLAAAAALASVAGVAHDLGRASIVRFEVRGWSAFGLGWRTLRIAPLTIWWSWAWRGGAGVVLVLLASVVAERIGGRGGVALLVLAVLHQAVVAARVALRASWLAGALRAVDGETPARDALRASPPDERTHDLVVPPGRAIPAAVETHHAAHEGGPPRRDARGHGTLDGSDERGGGGLVEEEPGARLELRVAVDDRVDQPARRVRDRQRAVALRVHLYEAARLVAARHEDEVGPREDAVHERLGRRAREGDAARRTAREGLHLVDQIGVAVAREDELHVGRAQQTRRGGDDDVDPLLLDHAAHERHDRRLRVDRERQLLLESPLAPRLVGRVFRVVARGQRGVRGRVPDAVIDAVEDARERLAAGVQDAVEPGAERGRLDLARVRGAHRRHRVGREDALLQEVDAAVELDPVDLEVLPADPERRQRVLGKTP